MSHVFSLSCVFAALGLLNEIVRSTASRDSLFDLDGFVQVVDGASSKSAMKTLFAPELRRVMNLATPAGDFRPAICKSAGSKAMRQTCHREEWIWVAVRKIGIGAYQFPSAPRPA